MARPTRRTTLQAYRVTVTGARPDPTGRRLVAELAGTQAGDILRLRQGTLMYWVVQMLLDGLCISIVHFMDDEPTSFVVRIYPF